MLTQYSTSGDIQREFSDDLKRAAFWMSKYCKRRAGQDEFYDVGCDIFYDGKQFSVSKPQFYTSPKTGNEWMMWWKAVNDGGIPKFSTLLTLYRMTEKYMMIMCPTMVCFGENDIRDGITIYTDHMFMRMHQRLGVDMSDRLQVIRNFVNHATETMMDTRPKRKGEQHEQIVCRLPGSWLRGHVEYIGDKNYIIKYRTFYTDRSLTPFQAKYLKSFRKFADKVSTMENFIELNKEIKEMEFEGRIKSVLPVRSGTGKNGEWKALPFVFEYFENETDRFPDSVLLETMDHDMMRNIGRFVVRGEDKKAIVKDGMCELTDEIKCRCGWSHRVNTFKRKDGTDGMMNNMRPYKLEILNPTADAEGTVTQVPAYQPTQQQAPFPATNKQRGETDDLPF